MIVKRIGVLSCGKVSGLTYALLGLLAGALFSVASLFGTALGLSSGDRSGALLGLLFGIGAVVILPVFYGLLGFIGGIVTAAIYNLIAGLVGGLELEVGQQ